MDGVLIGNGPGDPQDLGELVAQVRLLFKRPDLPIFGVCLGHQILGLAAGGETYKLPYGHRGANQPVQEIGTRRCFITSQNHGYAVNERTLPRDWEPWFVNLNDGTNEGIRARFKPIFSIQFHPEACPGPRDTAFLFDEFLRLCDSAHARPPMTRVRPHEPRRRVLLLGSGALQIGQAGEFDYSGTQAIKALREEGVYTVLVNPNIATIQTSEGLADQVYFVAITPENVERILEREQCDGILLGFGGQTALNCGLALAQRGAFERLGVQVLGTPISAIRDTEDRELFKRRLAEIGAKVPRSIACDTPSKARKAVDELGLPVMLRGASRSAAGAARW